MSKAGPKPSSVSKKKSARDKVNEEIVKLKRKGGGRSKLPLILAGVGVLLLIGVGAAILMFSGDDKPKPSVNPRPQRPEQAQAPQATQPAGPTLDPTAQQKIAELLGQLDSEKDRDNATKQLEDKL